jgi:2,3-bisphosphoglycerate-dependent phosphoglycerate mutase
LEYRHYGALQGLDKQQTTDKYGIDQVNIWRRSYDIPPPDCAIDSSHYPANDRKYSTIPEASVIRAESLKVCIIFFT